MLDPVSRGLVGKYPGMRVVSVHVGAGSLSMARHAGWPAVRAAGDAVARMAALGELAGCAAPLRLVDAGATRTAVCEAIAGAAREVAASGLLLISFAGHSEREESWADTRWCLHDGVLPLAELAGLLAPAPADARLVLVVDTCFAGTAARFAPPGRDIVVVAACGEDQHVLVGGRTSGFAARLGGLVQGAPGSTWESLRDALRDDTPDVERPEVAASRPTTWAEPAFAPPGSPAAC